MKAKEKQLPCQKFSNSSLEQVDSALHCDSVALPVKLNQIERVRFQVVAYGR